VVRTRFAPSPTGALHVGNARVAVLNWLLARREQGAFILRIEDTDLERNVAGAEAGICADLAWLGLEWDEGPACGSYAERGASGPYRQTERGELYRQFAAKLASEDHLYACFCSDAQLAADRTAALARGANPHYVGRCRLLATADAEARTSAGEPSALRFRVPDAHEIIVRDTARGEIRVRSAEVGDFIVLRSDGQPTYNFAVVVDDVTMRISHVIRGAGHLSNTPRQVLLYEALGVEPPVFAHVPTVLGPDRQKLSKRHGATSVDEYRKQGFHPDAVVNYLSLLSWSSPSGEEILTRERLVNEVSLERIGVADVVFDVEKLRFLSARHIALMPLDALVASVRPFLDSARFTLDATQLPVAVGAVRSHLVTFADINEQLATLFAEGTEQFTPSEDEREVLRAARDVLSTTAWEPEALAGALRTVSTRTGAKARRLYHPLRLAITRSGDGPPFVALLLLRGRERVLAALANTLATRPD
jgi:glutamyl-tRNA synthetase